MPGRRRSEEVLEISRQSSGLFFPPLIAEPDAQGVETDARRVAKIALGLGRIVVLPLLEGIECLGGDIDGPVGGYFVVVLSWDFFRVMVVVGNLIFWWEEIEGVGGPGVEGVDSLPGIRRQQICVRVDQLPCSILPALGRSRLRTPRHFERGAKG